VVITNFREMNSVEDECDIRPSRFHPARNWNLLSCNK